MSFETPADKGKLNKKVSAETPEEAADQVKVIHLKEDSDDPAERQLFQLRKQASAKERLQQTEKAQAEEMKQVQFGNLPDSVVTKEMLKERDETSTATKLTEIRQALKK
ncbi:MAG: hypothetical protein AAB766_04005 [Patescibacteria group bacterium]